MVGVGVDTRRDRGDHMPKRLRDSQGGSSRLTLQPHDTADHHNVALSPSLHARKHSFDQTNGSEEVGIEDVLHGS